MSPAKILQGINDRIDGLKSDKHELNKEIHHFEKKVAEEKASFERLGFDSDKHQQYLVDITNALTALKEEASKAAYTYPSITEKVKEFVKKLDPTPIKEEEKVETIEKVEESENKSDVSESDV